MKRTYYGAVVFAMVLLAGCASKEKEKETEPVVPVETGEVIHGSIQRTITGDGVLRALDQSAVMPKISAPVAKFYVNRGDHVTKGQLLATLENRDLAAAVADAKGAYEQAEAGYRNISSGTVPDELVKAQQDVQAAQQAQEAAQKLLESRQQLQREGALARRLVDEAAVASAQAKGQYETAKKHLESVQGVSRVEEVKSAEAQVASAKGKYEAAQAQLSYAEISSPISGVIADRSVYAGEMAATGSPLLTVMDVSSVIARVSIPQAQAVYVKIGQRAKVQATDGTVEVPGQVTVVSPAIDPNGTTVEVWVQAANPGERLRPGGTVHVAIAAETIPDATIVPAPAVLPGTGGGLAVMTVGADNVAHENKIDAGVRTAEKVQILKGVAPGARVVIEGGVGLQDGAKVKIGKSSKNDDR